MAYNLLGGLLQRMGLVGKTGGTACGLAGNLLFAAAITVRSCLNTANFTVAPGLVASTPVLSSPARTLNRVYPSGRSYSISLPIGSMSNSGPLCQDISPGDVLLDIYGFANGSKLVIILRACHLIP